MALRNAYWNLVTGAPFDHSVLGGFVGTRGPDSVDAIDGVRGGFGPPRATSIFPAYFAWRSARPCAQVYQRLLAMDDHDARAVADVYLAENSLVQLYDSVIIPALTMAEQDRHKGALDRTREEFIFLSIKEMIAEFSEKTAAAEPVAIEVATDAEEELKPADMLGRVLCLPAHDEADEIAAAMLAQLLEQAGCAALSLPLDSSLQHMLAIVEPGQKDVFCISAVPPFAFARARIVIGVWGFTGDTELALQRFQPTRPAKLVTSLADAVKSFADSPPSARATVPALSVAVS